MEDFFLPSLPGFLPAPTPTYNYGAGAMCVRPVDFDDICIASQFRDLQRSSSTHEPSDPLPRVIFFGLSPSFPGFSRKEALKAKGTL